MVRTLLFSTLYPSSVRPRHGVFVERRLLELLKTKRVETKVVAPVPWFYSTNEKHGEYSKFAATPRRECYNGVDVFHPRYLIPPRVGMNIAPLALALSAVPVVKRLLKTGFEFDLIDAHYYYPDGVAGAILSVLFDKPLVITARGTDLNLLPQFLIPRHLILWAASRATASIGVSRALMEKLVSLGACAEKTLVLRNGVDLERFSPKDKELSRQRLGLPPGRILLSVGNLVDLKGNNIIIEALLSLKDVHFVLVGDGIEKRNLEQQVSSLHLADRVTFAGPRSQSELPYWYSAADALILCSSREGWPNVLLESMACGTPVIATALPGIKEVVQSSSCARLIDHRDAQGVVKAVCSLFANLPHRSDARAYAEKFDWNATSDGQLELFRAIVGENVV